LARELTADIRDVRLNSREEELAEREKWLTDKQLQVLTATHRRLEELQATQAGEAQKVLEFQGQTEAALVNLGFSPLCIGDPVQEVSAVLPLLGSARAKMLKLGVTQMFKHINCTLIIVVNLRIK
jgi:hypothetical protein